MKREAQLAYYLLNGNEVSTEEVEVFDKIQGPSVYEVIRLINGVPLYVKEHLIRMRKSAEIVGYPIYVEDSKIIEDIHKIAKQNEVKDLNVKLLYSHVKDLGDVFLIYFIKSKYPDEAIYKEGISTILYHSERSNPNAKVVNTNLREKVNAALMEAKAFEALLVNKKGYITEGSRSNIFFVKEGKVVTAPPGEVLLGVTRNKIVALCDGLNLEVKEEHIHIRELDKVEGAFMTGTSVNVLPISYIDKLKYDWVHNEIIRKIAYSYMEDVRQYIESYPY